MRLARLLNPVVVVMASAVLVPSIQARAAVSPPAGESAPVGARKPLVPNTTGAWVIRREWTRSEVERYARWMSHIFEKKSGGSGSQRTARLSTILQDPDMNLLLQEGFSEHNDPRAIPAKAISLLNAANACGTFPILAYVYYCAVRGLPATLSRVDGEGGDIRYSRGNQPVEHFDPVKYPDLQSYVMAAFLGDTHYTTGNFRTAPDLEGTDTVPVAVTRESTVPGLTILYNSDGHGLVVAGVTPGGNLKILDAHPDGSITTGQGLAAVEPVLYSVPESARERWYAGWRAIRFAACVTDEEGRVIGTRPFTNEEMRPYGYSDETFLDVIAIRNGEPVTIQGQKVSVSSFPEYVRKRLQTDEKVDPKAMIEEWANQLHVLFTERASFVAAAWKNVQEEGAIKFPDQKNIYHAEGRWEDWSSPSSDCDRKCAYFLVAEQLLQIVRDYEPGQRGLVLDGFGREIRSREQLAEAILEAKWEAFDSRRVTYVSSRGKEVSLSLTDIEERLFLLSFDPNHPPELRWGALPSSEEAKGYKRIDTPLESGGELSVADGYKKQQRLRYRLYRKEGITGFEDDENPTAPPKQRFDKSMAKYVGKRLQRAASGEEPRSGPDASDPASVTPAAPAPRTDLAATRVAAAKQPPRVPAGRAHRPRSRSSSRAKAESAAATTGDGLETYHRRMRAATRY